MTSPIAHYTHGLIISRIERAEDRFLSQANSLQARRLVELEGWIRHVGDGDGIGFGALYDAPGLVGSMTGLILDFFANMVAMGVGEGVAEIRAEEKAEGVGFGGGGVNLAEDDQSKEPGFTPSYVVEFIESRRQFAEHFDQDSGAGVRQVILEAVRDGLYKEQIIERLSEVLIGASRARLDTIRQTESILAYNEGRLGSFVANKGFVVGVRFMAVGDSRTTPICLPRQELRCRLESPVLRVNIPPLHYRCRSLLGPLTKPKFRRAFRASGLLLESEYWAAEEAKWAGLPEPLPGFGRGGGDHGALSLMG